MGNLHPATQLLIFQSLFLMLGVPLMAWFSVVHGRADRAARWWYGGLALLGLGVLAVGLWLKVTAFTACTVTLSVLMCVAAIRMDAGRSVVWPRWLTPVFLVWCALYVAIDLRGQWLYWGVPTFMLTLSALYAYLLVLLVIEGRRRQSRGLLLVGVGVGLVSVFDALRGVRALFPGQADTIFSFALNANAVIVAATLSNVLMSLGYAAFILEKTHRARLQETRKSARAQAQALLAQEHAQAQQRIIAQRDAMLMANARFAAMNTLTMFHSAIVHELSQPLQSLTSILDKVEMRVATADEGLRRDVANAHRVLRQLGESLAALRQLIATKEARLETVSLLPVIEEVTSIVETEANRRGILFELQIEALTAELRVQADKVMLNRIVMNLVSNAFEAHAQALAAVSPGTASGPAVRSVRLVLGEREHQGRVMASVQVEDNGPGFDPELLAQVGYHYASTKNDGVGLGLVLTRVVVESWGGALQVRNRPSGSGAQVELLLLRA